MQHVLASIWLAIGSLLGIHTDQTPVTPEAPVVATTLGAVNEVAGVPYYLYGSGVAATDVSIRVTSFKQPTSLLPFTMSDFGDTGYGTLEPGNVNRQEFFSFTGVTQNSDGTAILTGVTRGLSPVSPYTASTTIRKAHGGGTGLVLGNTPQFYQRFSKKDTDETIGGDWNFTGQVTFSDFPLTPSNGTSTINRAGVSQLATPAQQAGGTATSTNGTNAPLVLSSQYATSTFNAATAANRTIISNTLGHIDAGFVSSSTMFSVTGTTTLAATSTISIGAFPAWQIGKQVRVISSVGTTSFAVPSGITKVFVEIQAAGGGSGNGVDSGTTGNGGGGGGGGGYANKIVDVSATTSIQVHVGDGGAGNVATCTDWSTFGTNGFYFYATGGCGVTAGLQSGGLAGVGVNGDINLEGADGASGVYAATSNSADGAGGQGGPSHMGGGGTAASAGNLYGGGAGGGFGNGNGITSGAAGAPGIVIIRW